LAVRHHSSGCVVVCGLGYQLNRLLTDFGQLFEKALKTKDPSLVRIRGLFGLGRTPRFAL
jgi:hypothetical protein